MRRRSSSPKLNFFIKIPVPTATAAAGVDILISHVSIDSNAEVNVLINFGYAAKDELENVNKKITNKMIIL